MISHCIYHLEQITSNLNILTFSSVRKHSCLELLKKFHTQEHYMILRVAEIWVWHNPLLYTAKACLKIYIHSETNDFDYTRKTEKSCSNGDREA